MVVGEEVEVGRGFGYVGLKVGLALVLEEVVGVRVEGGDVLAPLQCHAKTRRILQTNQRSSKEWEMVFGQLFRAAVALQVVLHAYVVGTRV